MNRRPVRVRTGIGLGLVLLAVVVGTVALLGSDASGLDVPTQTVQVKADPPGSPQTLRPLTSRQRRQSRRVLGRDGRFKRIIGTDSYRLKRIVPWGIQGKRREVFVGASLQAELNTPKATVVAKWPLVEYFDDTRLAYRVRTFQLTVRGLRVMLVNVDLKRRKVAGISPSQADEVTYPPGYTPRPPSGE
jgi:hypothetical protein